MEPTLYINIYIYIYLLDFLQYQLNKIFLFSKNKDYVLFQKTELFKFLKFRKQTDKTRLDFYNNGKRKRGTKRKKT